MNLKDFYCRSDTSICVTYQPYHKYKGVMVPNKETRQAVHSPMNKCILKDWKEYASYNRFAKKDFVKIEEGFEGFYVYTHWTVEDLIKEFIELHGGEKYCKILSIDWVNHY